MYWRAEVDQAGGMPAPSACRHELAYWASSFKFTCLVRLLSLGRHRRLPLEPALLLADASAVCKGIDRLTECERTSGVAVDPAAALLLVPRACNRWRSIRAPMAWPTIADAMVNTMAYLGIMTAFRSMAMNGMVACTARNHSKENFLVCSRHEPHGMLSTAAVAPTATSLMGSACGRSSCTGAVAASAARILTIASGQVTLP